VARTGNELRGRAPAAHLDNACAHGSVVRPDAFDGLDGRQRATVALLDEASTVLVISAIHARAQAPASVPRFQHVATDPACPGS